jgi:hypothetical protein
MPDPIRELPKGFLGSADPLWEKVLLDYLENGVEPTDERVRAFTLRYARDAAKKYLLLRFGDPEISAQWCAAEKVCRW